MALATCSPGGLWEDRAQDTTWKKKYEHNVTQKLALIADFVKWEQKFGHTCVNRFGPGATVTEAYI